MNAPPGQPPGGRPPYGQPGQMSFDPQTGKPIQPQQPAQPVYRPQQPAQPVYQPQQPAQPVYQPQAQPAQPVYQPQAQPAQPVYQPQAQPAQPVYRPQQPAQPVYQPQQPAQPVYQPQAQMQQARPMPGAAQMAPQPMAQPMPMAPAAPKKDETLALVAVLLAAAAWVLQFHIFMAVPAVICGHMARKKIKKEPDKFGGDGMAKAGIIIGWINIGLWLLGGIVALLFVVGTCLLGVIGAAAGG